jgi:hypothetical protein
VFCANFNYLSKNEADWQRWKTLLTQVNGLRETYCGDFYALTGWSLAEEDVAAWQYHRSDLGKALVQVFRRSKASMPADGYTFSLRGLDPKAAYKIEDLDNPDESKQMTGAELMEGGLNVALPQQPQSALFVLHKLP